MTRKLVEIVEMFIDTDPNHCAKCREQWEMLCELGRAVLPVARAQADREAYWGDAPPSDQ